MEKLAKQIGKKFTRKGGLSWPQDWILKVVSLLFALMLWYFVVGEAKVDITLFVPLEIVNLPQDLVISSQFKKELEVTVNGPRGLTRNIRNQHFSRPVNMENARPGTMVIQNDPDSINFPRGIRVIRIQPTNITIEIDRLVERELPVKATIKGKPGAGFEIVSISAQPPVIKVTAPGKIINPVLFLPTRDIDISGIKKSQSIETNLVLKPELAELLGDPLIKVRVTVKEKMEETKVRDLKIEFNGPTENHYRLSPGKVSVKALVPYHFLHGKDRIDLSKSLKAELAEPVPGVPGSHKVKVAVKGMPGIKVTEIIPPEVSLLVKRKNGPSKIKVIVKNRGDK